MLHVFIMHRLAQQLHACHGRLSSQDVANTTWALARLGYTPGYTPAAGLGVSSGTSSPDGSGTGGRVNSRWGAPGADGSSGAWDDTLPDGAQGRWAAAQGWAVRQVEALERAVLQELRQGGVSLQGMDRDREVGAETRGAVPRLQAAAVGHGVAPGLARVAGGFQAAAGQRVDGEQAAVRGRASAHITATLLALREVLSSPPPGDTSAHAAAIVGAYASSAALSVPTALAASPAAPVASLAPAASLTAVLGRLLWLQCELLQDAPPASLPGAAASLVLVSTFLRTPGPHSASFPTPTPASNAPTVPLSVPQTSGALPSNAPGSGSMESNDPFSARGVSNSLLVSSSLSPQRSPSQPSSTSRTALLPPPSLPPPLTPSTHLPHAPGPRPSPHPALREALGVLLLSCGRSMDRIPTHSLPHLVWALSRLGARPGKRWLAR